MAGSKKKYTYGKYNKKRKYGWYNFKNSQSVVSRAWKSIREANNTNSAIDFAFKVNYAFSASFNRSTHYGTAALNVYEILMKSQNFKNMIKNWDQVKVNGVTCKLNICDAVIHTTDLNYIKSINVVTSWDKSGLSLSDVDFFSTFPKNGNLIQTANYDIGGAQCYVNKIGEKCAQGWGCEKGLVNNFQRFTRWTKCFPTTQDEKSLYVMTSSFIPYTGKVNSNDNSKEITNEYRDQPINTQVSLPNPCVPFENIAIGWKPTLLVGVFSTQIERNEISYITNPEWVEWNSTHPTLQEATAYNTSVMNGVDTTNQEDVDARINRLIIPSGYDNATGKQYITTFLGTYDIDFNPSEQQWATLTAQINNNIATWLTANNPKPAQIVSPDYDENSNATNITQFGDVKPVIFNAEFTIPVTFKGQKGDM